MTQKNLKKIIIPNIPYFVLGLYATKLGQAWRLAPGTGLSEKLLRRREAETGTKADIHERDAAYLRRCRESAREIARALGWKILHCAAGGELRTPEAIHDEAWRLVLPLARKG